MLRSLAYDRPPDSLYGLRRPRMPIGGKNISIEGQGYKSPIPSVVATQPHLGGGPQLPFGGTAINPYSRNSYSNMLANNYNPNPMMALWGLNASGKGSKDIKNYLQQQMGGRSNSQLFSMYGGGL